MATLSALVEIIARVEGLDPSTVAQIAREIRQAGFIKTGGRGTSAAQMDFEDATNLLIAVNTTRTIREAPQMVSAFRALVGRENEGIDWSGKRKLRRPLRGTLGQALEDLFKAVAVRPLGTTNSGLQFHFQEALPRGAVALIFHKPIPRAELDVGGLNITHIEGGGIAFPLPTTPDVSLVFESGKAEKRRLKGTGVDRTETTSVSLVTIRAIADLLEKGV